MARSQLREKYGFVIILDALGASGFSRAQIKAFLSARAEMNSFARGYAKDLAEFKRARLQIYTFGDTLIITIPVRRSRASSVHCFNAAMLMRRYLFHSMVDGLLFRGSFSIGTYVEDPASNTVMGESVADAAAWYDKADWFGICSTPRTNVEIDYYFRDRAPNERFLARYHVPLKGGTAETLYCISWPGAFFDPDLGKDIGEPTPQAAFLAVLRKLSYPPSAVSKYVNARRFFDEVSSRFATSET